MDTIYYSSPVGILKIEADTVGISGLSLCQKVPTHAEVYSRQKNKKEADPDWLLQACKELDEYFAGKRKEFSVPLSLQGTEFQKKVWNALCDIPYGETRCYSDIAAAINNPKGCRAVGMANNKNPVMILVPCHRVIGKDGSLVGYGGGLPMKKYLLELEI